MSRGTATRRRGLRAQTWDEMVPPLCDGLADEIEDRADRLAVENARLRDDLAEVEGWYRLLQADHASLQARHDQVGRKAAATQAEVDRLGSRNRQLEAIVDRPAGSGQIADSGRDDHTMTHISQWFRSVRRHKWASAALVAITTLLARDPGVQAVFSAMAARVREVGRGDEARPDSAETGYVRYAAMIQARDEADKARADYNDKEATLKGDALLEAQDRLRAAKLRYRQARLAFLPELARQCERAHLPVPREATEALAMLRQEARD